LTKAFTRREFIKNAILASGGSIVLGACTNAEEYPPVWVAGNVKLIRKPIHVLNNQSDELLALKEGVAYLKSVSQSQDISLEGLARLHAAFCPHGNWFFLPWHGGFTLMVEEWIREITGFKTFAMPYWDWTVSPDFPEAFYTPESPLFYPNRDVYDGSIADTAFTGFEVINRILALKSFKAFGGAESENQRPTVMPGMGLLESVPHGYIHQWTGAAMAGINAPRDPLFLVHHATVDRIWQSWNQLGHLNPPNATFTNYIFSNQFRKFDGSFLEFRVSDLSDWKNANYSYDSLIGLETKSIANDYKKENIVPDFESWYEDGIFCFKCNRIEIPENEIQKARNILFCFTIPESHPTNISIPIVIKWVNAKDDSLISESSWELWKTCQDVQMKDGLCTSSINSLLQQKFVIESQVPLGYSEIKCFVSIKLNHSEPDFFCRFPLSGTIY
jgi:hypothetical protein